MDASPLMSQDRTEQDVARALAAAAAGDGIAAAQATIALSRGACGNEAVASILNAALDLDEPTFLRAATCLAILADMPVPPRVNAAWRLASAGKGEEAMAVLLADPKVITNTVRFKQMMLTLRKVQAHSDPHSVVNHQAGALLRRLLPVAPSPAIPSDHAFAGDAAAAPRAIGAKVAIHASPTAAVATHREIRAVHDDFERILTRVRHPTIAVFPDVFVNRDGQIWSRDGRLFRTYDRPIPEASRQAEATAAVLPEAALAVETHNNAYHWFAEWFPTLAWRLDDARGTVPLLIRDGAARYVTESLELGAAGTLEIATAGDAVFVEKLHVVHPALTILAHPEAVGGLMGRLRERAVARCGAVAGDRPVYISRRDTRKRRMANEAELEAALEQRGFDIVQMSSLSFAEQIARVAQAPRIVGAHGAGLALLAAATPGRQVVELMPAMRGSMLIRSNLAKISRIVGHSHHVWLQDIPGLTDVWTLDLDAFLRLLDSMPATATASPPAVKDAR